MSGGDSRRAAAVTSLFRVRAAESERDDKGHKTVWHQGANGADLLSEVDANGRVVRFELTLLGDHFRWERDTGLRTGRTGDGRGAGQSAATALVTLDPRPEEQRLRRAHDAMSSYAGDDRYLLTVKRVIGLVIDGLDHEDGLTVTNAFGMNRPVVSKPVPAKRPVLPVVLLAAAILLIIGTVAATLLTH